MSESNPQSLHPLSLASFSFDFRYAGYPLHIVAKRFSSPGSNDLPNAYTLLLATGIGSNTEVWIPTIRRLYELQSNQASTVRIGNVWVVEAPNHGDSAVLNEAILKEKFPNYFSGRYHGDAMRALLSSGMISPGPRLIAIGHSAGCIAHILAIPDTEPIPYAAFILIEPALFHSKSLAIAADLAEKNFIGIQNRVDVWPTTQDAMQWMKARYPWRRWHPEVLQAISDFGFRRVPTAEHPTGTGVTNKTYKGQEAGAFLGYYDNFKSVDKLARFCRTIPVHIIFAAVKDVVPKVIQDMITNPAEGRTMASISEVPDTGHFVIHENPDKISKMVFDILSRLDSEQITAKL